MSRVIHGVYAYFDNVAQACVQPILGIQPTDEAAIRDFSAMLESPKFQEGRNLGDYDLIRVGSWDVVENRLCEAAPDPSGQPLLRGTVVKAKLELAARSLNKEAQA